MQNLETSNCLICNNETNKLFDPQMKVTYLSCKKCGFISKQKDFFPDKETEKGRYDLHHNDDDYYRDSFSEVIDDYIAKLDIETILDFGSGPYPVLTKLLENKYDVTMYDPFYYNDLRYLDKLYDLVITSEAIEHFHSPRIELSKIIGLINKNKYLIVMTYLRTVDEERFLTWWYRRDLTHVGFYTLDTFKYIAKLYNLELITSNNKNIVVLKKIGD